MALVWSLLGILSGAFIAVQAPINAQLARGLGLPVAAAFFSFLSGTVVLGIVITNLRDRIIGWLVPGLEDWERYEADPVDYVVSNNLVLLALLAVLGVLLLLLGGFWLSWRFHTFRITGDDVEVRSGILFRTHRRAPLDRVQGVNLTRPMVARLLGAAKLEVVGAGLKAPQPVGGLVERGDDDDGKLSGLRVLLQPPADLEPVHARHHDVEQHEIAEPARADGERLFAVRGRHDLEIFGVEHRLEQLDVRRLVVDHEDAGGHQASPR